MPSVGQIIRKKRLDLGLTVEEVGKKVGVAAATVTRWESGEIGSIKLPVAWKLAQALQTSIFDLIPGMSSGHGDKIRIPIVGRVICGMPIFAEQNIEGEMYVDDTMAWGTIFGLRIVGKSMEPEIKEGDYIVVRMQSDVDNNDIAVVMIGEDEATCKQIHKTPDGVMLTAFNQDVYPATFYTNKQIEELPVKVIGKVIEIRRKI